MSNSVPKYKGQPTAYLDHNILDLLIKSSSIEFQSEVKASYQIIYSDESLKEIKRTGERGELFLNKLEELNAMYLRLVTNNKFELTGDATLHEVSPIDAFKYYCNSVEPIYQQIEKSNSQSLLKFFGGRRGNSFDDINAEQIASFNGLMEHLEELSDACKYDGVEGLHLGDTIFNLTKTMRSQYKQLLEYSTNELRKHIDDEEFFSGVNDYRSRTGVGPVQLNNIDEPDVVKKIWTVFSEIDAYENYNMSLEKFFGIDVSPIYDRQQFLFEKVRSIYNVLNIVGYQPDSKMAKEKRFVAAMSDAGHASMGSFADYVFSRDQAFIKKARAAYEYLNAKTRVIEVRLFDEK
ncbi:hypothetical protein FCL40_01150 [Ferrimonas sediminicola]|uniref:Uncharacterized protein n=1 Tax=Ferrimonas sediminicola TaxID=2569538 RepID=A0A4U1BIM4_9GAMM|nr:hypothetical protein [Ferrimonas sediminicola]TKB51193.1 hypothetical protein FCL40_01150 [Ferrimonas sediminicola]